MDMADEFLRLLNRTDLPAVIVEVDTTFDMVNYYVTWVTFRHVVFEDLPKNPISTMGLACLIHSRKTFMSRIFV
jgi:uncharacterized protein Yka (UPF0111/DUF47 family)